MVVTLRANSCLINRGSANRRHTLEWKLHTQCATVVVVGGVVGIAMAVRKEGVVEQRLREQTRPLFKPGSS